MKIARIKTRRLSNCLPKKRAGWRIFRKRLQIWCVSADKSLVTYATSTPSPIIPPKSKQMYTGRFESMLLQTINESSTCGRGRVTTGFLKHQPVPAAQRERCGEILNYQRAAQAHQFLSPLVVTPVFICWLRRDRLGCVFLGGGTHLPNPSTAAV